MHKRRNRATPTPTPAFAPVESVFDFAVVVGLAEVVEALLGIDMGEAELDDVEEVVVAKSDACQ
jgi:hypothetical protein